jgi:hypothetical protein
LAVLLIILLASPTNPQALNLKSWGKEDRGGGEKEKS